MACIHKGINCEIPFLEPFVAHYNKVESADYQFYTCLDKGRSSEAQPSKQPEALYSGEKSGLLTIERKIISWPKDAIKNHNMWHDFFEPILERHDLFADAPYLLKVPHIVPIVPSKFKIGRLHLEEQLKRLKTNISNGKTYRISTPFECRFRIQDEWERDESQPETGLMVTTNLPWRWGSSKEERAPIYKELERYFKDCRKKFSIWQNTRKILLLEPHGDITWDALLFAPWDKILRGDELDEIWTAVFYHEHYLSWSENWEFERIFPETEEKSKSA